MRVLKFNDFTITLLMKFKWSLIVTEPMKAMGLWSQMTTTEDHAYNVITSLIMPGGVSKNMKKYISV